MLLDVIKIEQPRSLRELWDAHGRLEGARVLLAGGTDLLVQGKDHKVPRGTWIDLSRVAELKGIDERPECVRLGALATYAQALRSRLLAVRFPAVVQGAREVGSPQIRSRGTFAGNCANASPAGDGIPPLFVHDARIVLHKVGAGTREVPVEDFFLGPRRTVCGPDELIAEIRLPTEPARRSAFLKLGTRAAMAIAKASVAVAARVEPGGRLSSVRVALGAVAPTVVRARATEFHLEGKVATHERLLEAARIACTECTPIDDFRSQADYRKAMIGVLVRRAFEKILAT